MLKASIQGLQCSQLGLGPRIAMFTAKESCVFALRIDASHIAQTQEQGIIFMVDGKLIIKFCWFLVDFNESLGFGASPARSSVWCSHTGGFFNYENDTNNKNT